MPTTFSNRPSATQTSLRTEWKESLLMALGSVGGHKLRSSLTLLGIMVGVFSIIVVMTALRALQDNIESELSSLGSTTFVITKWPEISLDGPDGWDRIRRRKDLTYQQGIRLQREATLAMSVGMETFFTEREAISKYYKTNPNVGLRGVTPEVFSARNWILAEGRAFMTADMDGARHVCVLGGSLARKLFPRGSALDERVKFDGINYQVIGVLESKGGSTEGDQDNFLVTPLSTGLNQYGAFRRSLNFLVQASSQERYEDTQEQVRGIMRTMRKVPPGEPEDFEVESNDSLVSQFRSISLAVRLGAALISSIALVAAGVGIMNIMLVSVTERTREIGIRRAIGAKRRNIMTQFIMEAVVLCQVGGIAGVILGVAAGNGVAYVMKVPLTLPVDWAIFGLLICCLVGIVFGTYPAYKAAHLDPIESLRYE